MESFREQILREIAETLAERERVSLTETDQFRRLVMFLEEVRHHARRGEDDLLMDMVQDCHVDLIESYGRPS